ncbi:hypothetical protein BOTCAL_0101g00090 [Botryotinia calthae]|uniref:Uncharacterized protein n=1 Tax=Botryotinia calthae TaxID=38488 RepID=A0A4Y8D628_9HELO|nr:hypothetical protein BOTCAL_0101g00090 [Botryotinia calthae]
MPYSPFKMATCSSKAPEYQMGEYVFTTTGWHVPKPEDISNDVTFIIAHRESSKPFQTMMGGTFSRNGRGPEVSDRRITFLNLPAAIKKKCPTVKKGGFVGTKAEDGNKVDLDGSVAPYSVVIPESSEDGEGESSRTNLIAFHLSAYSRTLETWYLEKALRLMEEADEDFKYQPAPSNTALRAFLDNGEEDFGQADAEAMKKEIAEL